MRTLLNRELETLPDGAPVIYRRGRYVDGLCHPNWTDWKKGTAHVLRRDSKVQWKNGAQYDVGAIYSLGVREELGRMACFGYEDVDCLAPDEPACLCNEGYYLELAVEDVTIGANNCGTGCNALQDKQTHNLPSPIPVENLDF